MDCSEVPGSWNLGLGAGSFIECDNLSHAKDNNCPQLVSYNSFTQNLPGFKKLAGLAALWLVSVFKVILFDLRIQSLRITSNLLKGISNYK